MTALLALLGLLAGPAMVVVPCHRLARRARAAGIRKGDRAAGVALVRPAEAYTVVAGLVLTGTAILVLCALAVFG